MSTVDLVIKGAQLPDGKTADICIQGESIIDGLVKATQPSNPKDAYSFSCYRATEYVILLSIAQELKNVNPVLLNQLENLLHYNNL